MDEGEVFVLNQLMPTAKIHSQIGFMPQNDALYDELSGLDNLLFFGRLYGGTKQQRKERAQQVLELMDLLPDQKKLVKNYSGGMKKRLSLAITLFHRPQLLILDEPTVGIDPILREKIWQVFHELKAGGTTIVLSTHVMDEAMKCDTVAMIYAGKLVAYDTVSALIQKTPNHKLEEIFFLAQEGRL